MRSLRPRILCQPTQLWQQFHHNAAHYITRCTSRCSTHFFPTCKTPYTTFRIALRRHFTVTLSHNALPLWMYFALCWADGQILVRDRRIGGLSHFQIYICGNAIYIPSRSLHAHTIYGSNCLGSSWCDISETTRVFLRSPAEMYHSTARQSYSVIFL